MLKSDQIQGQNQQSKINNELEIAIKQTEDLRIKNSQMQERLLVLEGERTSRSYVDESKSKNLMDEVTKMKVKNEMEIQKMSKDFSRLGEENQKLRDNLLSAN